MGDWINFNGSFISEQQAIIPAANRGLRYGDGVFETLMIRSGKIQLEDYHFQRLLAGIEALRIKLPKLIVPDYLSEQLLRTVSKNNLKGLVRARLMVFRGSGGLFETESSGNFLIECWPLSPDRSKLNENGLHIGIYESARKSCDGLANLKTNNCLVYAMAAIYAKENKFNDSLVMNSNNRICESSIANLFWIKNGQIFTPPLTEGCVAGVMRRHLLEQLPRLGYSVTEKQVEDNELEGADELFLSNAIGIRWVRSLNDKLFDNKLVSAISHSTIFSE